MLSDGTVLQNRYRIVRQLGQGGMGAVYEAVDLRLDTTVALKETLFADERLRRQFEREARLLARLHHQALPRVSDHFTEGDGQFLIMQYVAGDDLQDMLTRRNKPFAQAEVLTWGDQLCDALDYLHTQDPQIIHRDIKPQNLKLTARGQIVLLDFGLAKGSAGQMSIVTTSASIFGYTPNYAPLEQVQGLGTDARSDIYSLAATLYHLLTNVRPPDALSRAGAIVNGQPDPLQPAHAIAAHVNAAVASILSRGMAQKRNDRFESATEMRAALRAASESADALAEANTVLATGPLTSRDPKPLTSEDATRLVAEAKTAGAGSEAKTLLAQGTHTVSPLPAASGETTFVRPSTPAKRRGALVSAVVLIVLLVGIAAAFYAYRSRRTGSQTEATNSPTPAPSTEQGNPLNSQATPLNSPEQSVEAKTTDATKETAKTSTGNSSQAKQPKSQKNPRAEVSNAPRNAKPETPVVEIPAPPRTDPYSHQQFPNQQRPPNTMPQVRTFPNGTRMIIQPDGTRIVTLPNGATRVYPPGTQPRRRRIPN